MFMCISEPPEANHKTSHPRRKPTDSLLPHTIIVGDFTLTKLPHDKLLIKNSHGEAMTTSARNFAAAVTKFWHANF